MSTSTHPLPKIVVLTGAGISAESGIQTFRTPDGDGPALWAEHRVEDVATPAGYRRNRTLVHEFYTARREAAAAAEPNDAHRALARLGKVLGTNLLVVTQNVDDLHERGGLAPDLIIHMHGLLRSSFCGGCRERELDAEFGSHCPTCGIGILRPDIVWFGEQPYQMGRIERAVQDADMFVAVGTSGNVYPAAGLVGLATLCGARTLELNLSQTAGGFEVVLEGPATQTVPMFVDGVLNTLI